jgi:hypothetical protein
MSTAGSKIKDNDGEQLKRFSRVDMFPDGSSIEVYSSPDNQRMVFRHSSGSHLEFKADGSVFLKAMKDLHMNPSAASKQNMEQKGADKSTMRYDTDLVLDVRGRLFIKCSEMNVEVGSTARMTAGTDLIMSANNTIIKDTESLTLEPRKSLYIDSKEVRERVVYKSTYEGTDEDNGEGGAQVLKLDGKALIVNDDENGGITICTKGYLNFVCGQERVDIVGKYTEKPSGEAVSTFTQKVFKPEPAASQNKSTSPGGDMYTETYSSFVQELCTDEVDSRVEPYGRLIEVKKGDDKLQIKDGNREFLVKKDETCEVEGKRERKVKKNEKVEIQGEQKIKAKKIFLN